MSENKFIFISYSSKDKNVADALCHYLEERGIPCWIAPRDILPGQTWPGAIVKAIRGCSAMVLVFSCESNDSIQVANEVDTAFNYAKTIIPFMVDSTPMCDELGYYLSRKHWLVAYPDYKDKLKPLGDNLMRLFPDLNMSSNYRKPTEQSEDVEAVNRSRLSVEQTDDNYSQTREVECQDKGGGGSHSYTETSVEHRHSNVEVAGIGLRADGMEVDLETEINKFLKGNNTFELFVEKFGYDLWNKVTDDMQALMVAWRDNEEDVSINVLQASISNTIQESVEEFAVNASAYVEASIKESSYEIRTKVESYVSLHSLQGVDIKFSNNVMFGEVNLSDFNMDSVLCGISEKLKKNSNRWGTSISKAAIGGAVAMLLGGPLIWLIAVGALLSKWLFSEEKTEEQKQAEAMARDLNQKERIQVFNSINEEWDSIASSVRDSINESIENDASIKSAINEVAKEFMQAYMGVLKSIGILSN